MKPQVVFYLIQLLEGMGMGSMFPIYSPWLELHGLNFFKMGAVNFFYHISVTFLDPFTGFIADKFGKRKTFIVGQILWTSTQYIYGASSQITGFLLAEGIAAIGNSLKSDALESWLQNKLGENESSKVMGKSRSLFTVGQITTGILAGYISATYGMQVAWYVSGTFFLIATIIGGITLALAGPDLMEHKETHEETVNMDFLHICSLVIKNKKILMVSLIIMVCSFATKPLFMYWPQLVKNLDMPEHLTGWIILAISLPMMVGSLLTGHNVFFTKSKKGFMRLALVFGIGLAIAASATNVLVFLVGIMIVESGVGSMNLVTYGYLYQDIHPRHRSTINSIIGATKTFSGALSLLIMGEIADVFSIQTALAVGSMLITAVIVTSIIVLTLQYYSRSRL